MNVIMLKINARRELFVPLFTGGSEMGTWLMVGISEIEIVLGIGVSVGCIVPVGRFMAGEVGIGQTPFGDPPQTYEGVA